MAGVCSWAGVIDAFKKAVKTVFSNTKRESDRQLAELQASNLQKREAKKRG
jgi:hypothetical protein